MKKLIYRLTLPLTLISFFTITKWSYGTIIDGTDEFFYGFPFIYTCRGFHTSLSTQYFITEMLLNLLTYFVFWLLVTLLINRFVNIRISKIFSKIVWVGLGVLCVGYMFNSYQLNDRYTLKRTFQVELQDSGIAIFGMCLGS